MSLAEIQEVPKESLILLSGPPGAGKSTFCHQVVLNNLAMDRPIIFVTTEHSPTEVIGLLRERGMGESPPASLSFVDAFGETVGVTTPERLDTIGANCEDLNSISMAIAKLQQRIGKRDILLSFDSLTSPYLFNKEEVFRFIRLCLAKFASEGNSVLALVDEGCGKEEDLGAMMSVADGIIKIEIRESSRIISVVKHPKVVPTTIEARVELKPTVKTTLHYEPSVVRQIIQSSLSGVDKGALRREVGYFVNLFWPNLAHWSGMLWDPKGFPTMIYELNKERNAVIIKEVLPYFPWRWRALFRLISVSQALGLLPKNFSKVKDMKKVSRMGGTYVQSSQMERSGNIEYLEDISKTDEHYFRVYENSDCCGFENVGATIASHLPPAIVGQIMAFEKDGQDWNAIETKCVALGDPYCEFKLVPGEIDELRSSLEKDSSVVERIHERLMERLMGFLLDKTPL
jgi:KaiC/GvpD/RAD55 family RecA-like ATPase